MDFTAPQIHTPKEMAEMLRCASALDQVPGCQDAVNVLASILKKEFEDVPVKNGRKTIGSVKYYVSGVMSCGYGTYIVTDPCCDGMNLDDKKGFAPNFAAVKSPVARMQAMQAYGNPRAMKDTGVVPLLKDIAAFVEKASAVRPGDAGGDIAMKALESARDAIYGKITDVAHAYGVRVEYGNAGGAYVREPETCAGHYSPAQVEELIVMANGILGKDESYFRNKAVSAQAKHETMNYRLRGMIWDELQPDTVKLSYASTGVEDARADLVASLAEYYGMRYCMSDPAVNSIKAVSMMARLLGICSLHVYYAGLPDTDDYKPAKAAAEKLKLTDKKFEYDPVSVRSFMNFCLRGSVSAGFEPGKAAAGGDIEKIPACLGDEDLYEEEM